MNACRGFHVTLQMPAIVHFALHPSVNSGGAPAAAFPCHVHVYYGEPRINFILAFAKCQMNVQAFCTPFITMVDPNEPENEAVSMLEALSSGRRLLPLDKASYICNGMTIPRLAQQNSIMVMRRTRYADGTCCVRPRHHSVL